MSKLNFPEMEEKILKFWQDSKIFEKSIEQRPRNKAYIFYDGPPFATGLPHYGHIVASLMKDVVPRYFTMKGRRVERVWGWDCHGLPIENLVEQDLKIKSKKEIEEKVGVEKFNEACRSKVLMYAEEWKKFIPRMGRWVDMDKAYKTMDLNYMESIWWVFKGLWDKGLIYEDCKSIHICPRCETTLSQSEVTQGYQDITDLSVIAKFELEDEPGTYILSWTTTPWTLPGNVALALGAKIKYVKVKSEGSDYILASANLEQIFEGKKYEVVGKIKAKDLAGKKYKPLFDYFVNANFHPVGDHPKGEKNPSTKFTLSGAEGLRTDRENLYTIQLADFVTVEDGTGVVHIAPGFGEDDMNLGREKNLPTITHVTPNGHFTAEVKDFAGELVKPKGDTQRTDRKIVTFLEKKDLVFKAQNFTHSYPLCWRCDTPLLNYSTSSWFVKVTAIKERMRKLAKEINWVPGHLKEGRFGQWLEGVRDWAISRQRFWGSVMPVWRCQTGKNQKSKIKNQNYCNNIKVLGSIRELEELSGLKVTDLHKHSVDKITFKCDKCGGEMRRIPDVLDCWFESSSMPYAQVHYPFENKEWLEKNFPAEFIAEGVDQTRCWFYYLHVISTAIKDSIAFENVIANGIVLAADGKKMSKRLKNYPEPEAIISKYGADAMRYYLLTSPVMKADDLNFSEAGVAEVHRKVLMLLGNVFSFWQMYADHVNRFKGVEPLGSSKEAKASIPILDRWILAKLNLLIKEVTENMDSYDLVKATRPIGDFIDELSTWWLRRSRERFKTGDRDTAFQVLSQVLLTLSKIMAPFMPFTAEELYQKLGGGKESVHLGDWPVAGEIDEKVLERVALTRQIVERLLAARAKAGIKVRQALSSYSTSISTSIASTLLEEDIEQIKEEGNVKELRFVKEGEELDIKITNELKQEGIVRELTRQINTLRKEAGLTLKDRIIIYYQADNEIRKIFSDFIDKIRKDTLSDEIKEGRTDTKFEKRVKLEDQEIWLGITLN